MKNLWQLSECEDSINTLNDTPVPWGLFFQDNATPQMEGLEELHNNIIFYLAIIMFSVS
jgi:Cytochrome C oxidase subunit II, transmembrane domain